LIPDSRGSTEIPSTLPPRASDADLIANPEVRHGEFRQVLEELDRLSDDLHRRPGPDAGKTDPIPVDWDEGTADATGSSPYLDERLAVASVAVSSLSRELRELGDRWHGVQEAAERVEREIGHASLESGFLRSAKEIDEIPSGSSSVPRAMRVASPAPLAAPARKPSPPRPTQYGGFTVARYNATIGGLKARRRRLAWWTVLLAAGISAVLVALAVLAREPVPSLWLALLPAVWMIPVPFFVISFFSTQRILRRNRLDMTGSP